MIVSVCQHEKTKKHGKDKNGNPRRRCCLCGKTWIVADRPLGAMRTSVKEAALALGMLLEGMSVRAVGRLTGLKPNTICDLILTVGDNCQRLLAEKVKGVNAQDIQCDELWGFVLMKERQRRAGHMTGDEGDWWTYIGIDRDTKLVLAHHVGQRDGDSCERFVRKLYNATSGRCQISTDGLGAYSLNIPFVFRGEVDFGQLIKKYQNTKSEGRYSPPRIIRATKRAMYGDPDMDLVCTSHVERLNLTVRMTLRRFTRLTNGHSKSLAHHKAMLAIFFAWYNLCRKHETLKATPAMAAGLTDKPWTIRELLEKAART
jgi:IS1 family transposase/transposase-like protein